MDRIPWPAVRDYLVQNGDIRFDDFAAAYSSHFIIKWDYDPDLVVIERRKEAESEKGQITINPVYEEHMRQIRNWTVGEAFRHKFPELARLIDLDSGQDCATSISGQSIVNHSPR